MERSKSVHIRLSDEEYKTIKNSAESRASNISDYLRFAGLQDFSHMDNLKELGRCLPELRSISDKFSAVVKQFEAANKDEIFELMHAKLADAPLQELNQKLRYIGALLQELTPGMPSLEKWASSGKTQDR